MYLSHDSNGSSCYVESHVFPHRRLLTWLSLRCLWGEGSTAGGHITIFCLCAVNSPLRELNHQLNSHRILVNWWLTKQTEWKVLGCIKHFNQSVNSIHSKPAELNVLTKYNTWWVMNGRYINFPQYRKEESAQESNVKQSCKTASQQTHNILQI